VSEVEDADIEAEETDTVAPATAVDVAAVAADAEARCAKMAERGRSAEDIAKTYSGFVVGLMSDSHEEAQAALSAAMWAEADRRVTALGEQHGPYARGRLAAKVVAGEYDAG
jgi:hypothetical protein